MKLYENLGFVRDKRLFRYYLNGVDALRLKLWLRWSTDSKEWLHPHGSDFCMQCNLCRIALQVDLVIPMQLLSVSVHWVSHNICCTLAWRIYSELNEIVFKLQGFFWYQQDVPVNSQDLFICKVCWQCYLHSDHFITEPVSGTWFLFLKEANVVKVS